MFWDRSASRGEERDLLGNRSAQLMRYWERLWDVLALPRSPVERARNTKEPLAGGNVWIARAVPKVRAEVRPDSP